MARATKQHPMNQIADEGLKQAGKGESTVGMTESVIPILRAQGSALAVSIAKEADKHGSDWTRFYQALLELSPEGRDAFHKEIRNLTARPRGSVLAVMDPSTGKPIPNSEDWAGAMRRSGRQRLSEFDTIAKALDNPGKPEFDKAWAFHTAVGYARVFLKSHAAGDNRGRKAKSTVERLIDYLIADHKLADGTAYNYIAELGEAGLVKAAKDAVKAAKKATAEKLAAEKAKADAAPAELAKAMKESLQPKAKLPRKTLSRVRRAPATVERPHAK